MKNYFLRVSKSFIEDQTNRAYVTPIMLYIEYNRSIVGRCTTTLSLLHKCCGYIPNGNSLSSEQRENIQDALVYLQTQGFIKAIYDAITGGEIHDYYDISPRQLIIIENNYNSAPESEFPFTAISIDYYEKIISRYEHHKDCKLWRILTVLLYLVGNMRPHKSSEFTELRYYRTILEQIRFDLSEGFSIPTIIKCIGFLEQAQVLRHKAIKSVVDHSTGAIISAGTVYMLDEKEWSSKIKVAAERERNRKSLYFEKKQKGELVN